MSIIIQHVIRLSSVYCVCLLFGCVGFILGLLCVHGVSVSYSLAVSLLSLYRLIPIDILISCVVSRPLLSVSHGIAGIIPRLLWLLVVPFLSCGYSY